MILFINIYYYNNSTYCKTHILLIVVLTHYKLTTYHYIILYTFFLCVYEPFRLLAAKLLSSNDLHHIPDPSKLQLAAPAYFVARKK